MTITTIVLFIAAAAQGAQGPRVETLPAGVQKAIQQEKAEGATIKSVAAEKQGGMVVYEIETMRNGHARDLLVDGTGRIVEVEEEVAIDAVPAAVRTALEALGKVVKVEIVTKGMTVSYEAQVEKNGKRSEVAVDASGKRVKT